MVAAKDERNRQLIADRVAGLAWTEIAARHHISPARCLQVYKKHTAAQDEEVRALRQLELVRLDALWAAIFPAALAGNLRAVRECVRLSKRRSELAGLDAPTKLQVEQREPLLCQDDFQAMLKDPAIIDEVATLDVMALDRLDGPLAGPAEPPKPQPRTCNLPPDTGRYEVPAYFPHPK
jgi:hypothetical protein